ncbi:hypothetical protein RND81_09G201800 [Saponaria officinalis]|uniref:Uncharacterized protein n=1 Tax=Saponaria officinalis TaxID=3572 RepID=A0AAW1IN98_SAPOF
MGTCDFDGDSSGSDCDDFLRQEIESLSKACLPTLNASDDDDDDDFDDMELVRSIRERYGVDNAGDIKPLATLPPPVSDDDDDDYEFYRAIKERFSQHGAEAAPANAGASPDSDCRDKYASNDVTGAANGRNFVDDLRDDVECDLNDTAEKQDAFTSASNFPRAAQTFIEAIKKNRSCQKFVRNKLLHIEAKMEEIKEVRKRLKTLRDFQVQCKKKIGRAMSQKQDARVQLISVHRQRANAKGAESNVSAICYGPQENSYVSFYKAAFEKFPLSFHRDKWTEEDRQNLEKGIIRQYQEKLLQRSEAHVLSSAEEPGFANGVDAMMVSIKNHNITPETIQRFSGKVNWDQLASIYLPRRSGEECETRWLNFENRLINTGYWTKEEEKKLLSLIEKNGFHNWNSVAEKLSTNRTPYQCLARYQRSLNASILKKDWTEDEDAQLRSAVESFGESNWQAVASVLEGRTGTQCSNRWKKTLHPARERVGKWSDDEDKRLMVAVTLFDKSWHRVAQFVPGRTQSQCRERWVNVLDPSLKRCEWTEEEDLKLKEAIAEHGYCWSRVAACVPLRTDNQCSRRWRRLFPDEVPKLKAAKYIKKIALISNFVDREEERPSLGPKDFVSLPIENVINEQENGKGTKKRKRKCKEKQIVKLSSRKCKEKQVEKLSSSCNLRRSKRKTSVRAVDKKLNGYSDEESNYEEIRSLDKRITSKTGSKTKKCDAMAHPKDNNCKLGISDDGAQTHFTGTACSKQKNAKKKHKKRKVDTDQSEEWNLPLSVLFKKALRHTH